MDPDLKIAKRISCPCGASLEGRSSQTIYCSVKCRREAARIKRENGKPRRVARPKGIVISPEKIERRTGSRILKLAKCVRCEDPFYSNTEGALCYRCKPMLRGIE